MFSKHANCQRTAIDRQQQKNRSCCHQFFLHHLTGVLGGLDGFGLFLDDIYLLEKKSSIIETCLNFQDKNFGIFSLHSTSL